MFWLLFCLTQGISADAEDLIGPDEPFVIEVDGELIANPHISDYVLRPCSKPSVCVPISHCSPICDESENPDEVHTQYTRAPCGFIGDLPMTCCERELVHRSACVSTTEQLVQSSECGRRGEILSVDGIKIDAWPWAVRLLYPSPEILCSGVLISPSRVLTAGHCLGPLETRGETPHTVIIDSIPSDESDLLDGTGDVETARITATVRKILKHPDMMRKNGAYRNDLGLLFVDFLPGHVAFVRSICVSDLEPPFDNLESPILLGWGLDSGGRPSDGLKQARIRLKSEEECSQLYRDYQENIMTCGGSACRGDSGAPLIYRREEAWHLAGMAVAGGRLCDHALFIIISGDYKDWALNAEEPGS